MSGEQVLRSRRVVTGSGVREAAVVIRDGKVAAVVAPADVPAGLRVEDLGDKVLMPGVVDCHAHINEPGRTEWEGFETATRAAAAGGITTVVDMPLNSIPATTSREALRQKAASAEGHCTIDYGFWGGVIPGNAGELDAMVDAGVTGFKCFLIHSGVDEFPHVTREDLDRAMPILARRGVPLIVHAEMTPDERPPQGDTRTYRSYLESRPRRWEDDAIRMMIELCRKHRGRVHIVHLSSSDALPDIAAARREGLPFGAETCPHYLTFDAEHIPDGATYLKCAPPIREAENREKLWAGLARGEIDMVVSDHSPCTPGLKHLDKGDFAAAWGGIASLQFSLPAVWTGMRARGHGLESLVRWMCQNPARLIGLEGVKGSLTPGADADLIVFDPEASFTPEPSRVLHRHSLTPYTGRPLVGVVERTYVRGQQVQTRGEPASRPVGQWVRRPGTARPVA
ncbi:allantoinase AllB [Vitiosangium sp. GDMCC 1.1324]|uniref:allantoinase AllB n=1 Tax=Vitiosangium sp. (strain GDMCC 1.1324) TaxID=2138576 RepID=UPI000D36F8C3|nr:allantoinase AllB [Vitiosangium sp. GDMCC 1.1324]PTL81504.1 allantoinase AllB [Vitiosangium sp. GDMCC 1.1324]